MFSALGKKKQKNLRVKSFQRDGSHFQVVLWNISLVFHGFVLRFSPFFLNHIYLLSLQS